MNNYIIDISIKEFIKNYTTIREKAEWFLNKEMRDNCLDNDIKWKIT